MTKHQSGFIDGSLSIEVTRNKEEGAASAESSQERSNVERKKKHDQGRSEQI